MPPIVKLGELIKTVSHETLPVVKSQAMQPTDETHLGIFRIALAWLAYFLGSITLQEVGVFLAIIFTTLQIIVLLRDKFGLFNSSKEKK